ncbi:MAG TPA: hypothetical protein VK939_16250 [Longimicrobiales bacterium]|nr:hypothetical protein [Longimicrobiales bacterium]
MNDNTRLVRAAVAAPITAVLAIGVMLSALDLVAWPTPVNWVAATGGIIAVFMLYGAPVAFVIELLVGVPAYYLLRSRQRLAPVPIIIIGALAGGLTFTVVSAMILGSWEWVSAGMIGTVAGALAGAVFWRVGLHNRPQVPFLL